MGNGRHFLKKSKWWSHVMCIQKFTKKKKVLAKFHVNSNFLLLRNNSDNKYMTPQTTALDEIRL